MSVGRWVCLGTIRSPSYWYKTFMSRNNLTVENTIFLGFLENFVGFVCFLNVLVLVSLTFLDVLIVHVTVTAYVVQIC